MFTVDVLSEHLSRTRCPAGAIGACLWESDWQLPTRLQSGDSNAASRLLTGGIERAQFTPAQHDKLRPQPVVMRTDAKAPAKPACHFMRHPLPLNATRYHPALWQEFENFRSLSDHSRAAPRREQMSMSPALIFYRGQEQIFSDFRYAWPQSPSQFCKKF